MLFPVLFTLVFTGAFKSKNTLSAPGPVEKYLTANFSKLLSVESANKNLEAQQEDLEIAQSRFRTELKGSAQLKSSTVGDLPLGTKNYTFGATQSLPLGIEIEAVYSDSVPGFNSSSSLNHYQLRSLEISQNLWPNILGRSQDLSESVASISHQISKTENFLILTASCKNIAQLVTAHGISNAEKSVLDSIVLKNQKALDWARQASREKRIRNVDLFTAEEQSLEAKTRLKEAEVRLKLTQKSLGSLLVDPPTFELTHLKTFYETTLSPPKKTSLESFPEYQKSALQMERQNKVASLSDDSILPQVQHSLALTNKDSPSSSTTENSLSWGLTLSVPLWGPKEWKTQNRENLLYSSQILKHQNTKNELQAQYENLLNEIELAEDQLSKAEALKILALKKTQESEAALRKGQIGFFEFSSYERSLRQSELEFLNQFSRWTQTLLELNALTGDLLKICRPENI